jgi:hypothetical protein
MVGWSFFGTCVNRHERNGRRGRDRAVRWERPVFEDAELPWTTLPGGDHRGVLVTRGASARLGRFIEWLRPTPMVGRRGLRDCDGDEGAVAAKLIDASNMSLDGCTEDARGASTLAAPLTANTRLERDFDPSAVLDLKAAAIGMSWSVARTSQHRLSSPG